MVNSDLCVLKILALTKYGHLGASSRMRCFQYLSYLQRSNIHVTISPLLSDDMLQLRYQLGSYGVLPLLRTFARRCRVLLDRHQFDALWIEKEALPWFPLWFERTLLSRVPYMLDYDDAIFHNYDQHHNPWVRWLYGKRLDGLMAHATLVVAGNNYLAERARSAGARRVELLPTVIDIDRYPLEQPFFSRRFVVGWIGSPSTVKYLKLITPALITLAEEFPLQLRVVGAEFTCSGLDVDCRAWSEESEVQEIQKFDVGIMPLNDSPWERGKCGYKLIQYMACGLPVVASPVGVNVDIVQQRYNGLLARNINEWTIALRSLKADPDFRVIMGARGRRMVEENYCLQVTAPRLAVLLRSCVGQEAF